METPKKNSPRRINSFRELASYQMARAEARRTFEVSRRFPKEEAYALTDQVRRSSRAVGALLAEAWGRRRYEAAFINKVNESLAEATETQAWLDYALDCGYVTRAEHKNLDAGWQTVGGKLQQMIIKAESFCRNAP